MTLLVAITDADTGQPVPADIWVNGLKAVENVSSYDISLRLLEPGQKSIRLRVEADGYGGLGKMTFASRFSIRGGYHF